MAECGSVVVFALLGNPILFTSNHRNIRRFSTQSEVSWQSILVTVVFGPTAAAASRTAFDVSTRENCSKPPNQSKILFRKKLHFGASFLGGMLLQGSEQVIDAQRPACYQQHTVNTPVAHCAVSRTHALEEATQQQWNQQRCSQLLPSRCTAGTMASASSPKEVPSSPTVHSDASGKDLPAKYIASDVSFPRDGRQGQWRTRTCLGLCTATGLARHGTLCRAQYMPVRLATVGNGRQCTRCRVRAVCSVPNPCHPCHPWNPRTGPCPLSPSCYS